VVGKEVHHFDFVSDDFAQPRFQHRGFSTVAMDDQREPVVKRRAG